MKIPVLNLNFYLSILPILLLSLGSLVHLIQSCLKNKFKETNYVVFIQLLTLAAACIFLFKSPSSNYFLSGSFELSQYGLQGSLLIIIISIFISLFFAATYQKDFFFRAEISAIYLITISGLLILISSQDFITIFIGIEMSSIGLYALVGYVAIQRTSLEGAIKYLILGALSTGLFLFGVGLIYASCKSLNLGEIKSAIPFVAESFWFKAGSLLILSSLGFKMALVPFHMWSPDIYQAASSGITAFMATNIKIALVLLLMKLISYGFGLSESWQTGLFILAVLSIIIGNILALSQTSVRRLLAYSSIAHSGYMTVALCSLKSTALDISYDTLVFYLIGYSTKTWHGFC